ncbi:MAG TPA: hypothetical protein VNU68_31835 [Verrucomicrobiae bacterium]|nr:hypothetical protein [Verrucomicrobiae bacterium]
MKDKAREAFDEARRLADAGDYESALATRVWFHNHCLEVDPGYYGVRLSYALSHWVELGRKFPKALERLKDIRDEKVARLLAGESNRDLFNEVEAINRHLNDFNSTIELFKRIETTNPSFAFAIYDLVDEALLHGREYALAKKHLGDPQKHLAAAQLDFEEGMDYAATCDSPDALRRAYESIFTECVLRLIKVLDESDDLVEAKRIQSEALKTLDNHAIRDAIK